MNDLHGLRVVAYYRMSSDEQSLSIGQQEKEIRRYCEQRGWVIVFEYYDRGRSGSKDIAKRVEFHRMVADSAKGEWQAIVCYDTSRFGRLDSLTGAPFKTELRKNGVVLETVKDGRIDWTTSMGRIMDTMLSEKNHEYSILLSHSVIRGRTDIAEKGFWAHGHIPYGYDREYIDETGTTIGVYPRKKIVSKARNWRTKLKVNETESKVVKSIFNRLATEDISVRGLATELNVSKVPAPGGSWTSQQIRYMIHERAYIGQSSFGFGRKIGQAHNRVETRVVDGACPALLDPKVWESVQKKVAERRVKRSNTSQARSGPFSGILICGHCGKPMHIRRRKGQDESYVCSSAQTRPHLGCKQFSVKEHEVMQVISEKLFEAVDAALLDRLTLVPPKKAKNEIETLTAHVAKLEKQYERARANLLLADPTMFKSLQSDAMALKAELDKAKNTLTIAGSDVGKDDWQRLDKWWKDQKNLVVVPKEMKHLRKPSGKVWQFVVTSSDALRSLLKLLNAQLTLHWTIKGNRYYALKTGVLTADFMPSSVNVLGDGNSRNTQNIHIEIVIDFAGISAKNRENKYETRKANQRAYRREHPRTAEQKAKENADARARYQARIQKRRAA